MSSKYGSSKIRRWLVVALAVIGLTLGSAVTATSASAGNGSGSFEVWGSVGVGGITNWTSSSSIVYNNQGWNFVVYPGQTSWSYRQDTDGYFIGAGFCANEYYLGYSGINTGKWMKIRTVRAGSQGVSVKIPDWPREAVEAYRC